MALLRERASALGVWLTGAELDAVTRFLEGESLEEIAAGRELSARTVSNQIRSGCRRLGFGVSVRQFGSDRQSNEWDVALTLAIIKQAMDGGLTSKGLTMMLGSVGG